MYPNPNLRKMGVIEEDFIVQVPKYGNIYHVTWAKQKGMQFKLLSIVGSTAYLETPKTHKRVTCERHELREINSRAIEKMLMRTKKGKYKEHG